MPDVYPPFPYRRPPELAGGPNPRRPVVIVGAGPVGLSAAIDLATRGVPSVLVDDSDRVSVGSRAICWAKRTLEIFDRLGVGDRMVDTGVTWQVGRTFHGDREIIAQDLLPEAGHKMPAFINLQQYYVERFLVERAGEFPDFIDLRWKSKVVGIEPETDGVALALECPDGPYRLRAEWVIAADGARSPIRSMLRLAFEGRSFEEKFLIADVKVAAERPNERHFWFRPTFDPGESVLVHRQPDDVYRIDFQLGPDADAEKEREPARVEARVRAVFGEGVAFTHEWSSVYSFRCARLERFVHGRVVFAGDSAHVVSPFGARGGNGGIQDVDNLCWKLASVLRGEAPAALVATYDEERGRGADENILHSARTTAFMTPKTRTERAFRDGVLLLAADHAFARRMVNGGRLSRPCSLAGLSLQTPGDGAAAMGPGDPIADAPLRDEAGRPTWLLRELGQGFTAVIFGGEGAPPPPGLPDGIAPLLVSSGPARPGMFGDPDGEAHRRCGAEAGTTLLVRPDQHVAARFGRPDGAALATARRRATARTAS